MPVQEQQLLSDSYGALTRLGISRLSSNCYQVIYQHGFISAAELALILNKPYRSIYRNLKDLQTRGFIKQTYTGRHPHRYQAVLLQDALIQYAEWQKEQIKELLNRQNLRYLEVTLKQLKAKQLIKRG